MRKKKELIFILVISFMSGIFLEGIHNSATGYMLIFKVFLLVGTPAKANKPLPCLV